MFIEIFFHFLSFLIYAWGIAYDFLYVTIPGIPRTFVGRLKFLTYWDLIIQMVYYAFCIFLDISNIMVKCKGKTAECPIRKKLLIFRDRIFNIIVFPLGTFVFSMFWLLYAIDRELIFPTVLDSIIPGWLNHVMHTIILPTSLVEVYLSPHKIPKRTMAYTTIVLFLSTYTAWTFFLSYLTGIWTYPIFEVLNSWQLMLFCLLSLGIYIIVYLISCSINKALWGTVVKDVRKKAN